MKSMHALYRTSPKGKGQPFIGNCYRCGAVGLTLAQSREECANPANLTTSEAFALVINGGIGSKGH